MITWMKKAASGFQIEKFSRSICLVFRQLQHGVAYKSVKKNRVSFSYYFHDSKYMYFSEHI